MPRSDPPAGVDRRELVAYLDGLLRPDDFSDYGPNGVQVEGRPTIRKLVTGVSACRELFVLARRAGADAVLVHHGLFWSGQPSTITGIMYPRVRELIEGGLSLIAYHLPLDAHAEWGNNALGARALGLVELEPFAEHKGRQIGFHGRFPEPVTAAELLRRTAEVYGQEPLAFTAGPDPLSTLGIISGGAQREVHRAIALGLDAFLTGEVSEWVMNTVREHGIHYLAAGHYATERLGVRELGRHLAERFAIEVEFIDVPNPV